MALEIGNASAAFGMSKAVFDQLDAILMTVEEKNELNPEDLEIIRTGWRKLAFALASGVIPYITANMEINGITTQGNVNATVTGTRAVQNNVVFTQNNDGLDHVR